MRFTLDGVSFELANGRLLFENLHLTLDARLTALVGPNGVGKTTLARLLVGELEPSAGHVRRATAVAYLAQSEVPPSTTIATYLGGDYAWSALGAELLGSLDLATDCATLSGGQWMRVRLARQLREDYLILDEPTNDLDRDGRAALATFLRGFGGGALVISHDRALLRLCDEILELSNRGLAKYGGGFTRYEDEKTREREGLAERLACAKRARDAAETDRTTQIARQEKRNRRGRADAARGGTPKILLGARKRRAQATTGKVDSESLDRAHAAVADAHSALTKLKVDPVMYAQLAGAEIPEQKLVAEARGLNVRFGDWLYPRDLDFTWRGGVRLALKGPNGSGKSTLLRAISGERLITRGTLRTGPLVTLYVDQRCAQLEDGLSVLDNVRANSRLGESEIRNALAKFLFTGETVFQIVGSLSGGERLRAALARGFLASAKPELLILDEPTNNLDLANVAFLENLLRQFRGALLVVSHDEEFLANIGTEDFEVS